MENFSVLCDLSRKVNRPFNWQTGAVTVNTFFSLGIKEIPLLQLKNTNPFSMKKKNEQYFGKASLASSQPIIILLEL